MSFEPRLRAAFNRAADNRNQAADEVLVGLIATYHAQRRQRVMYVAAAAATLVAALFFGNGAVRWIQGLDESIPPAESDHFQEKGRSLEQAQEQELRGGGPQNETEIGHGSELTMASGSSLGVAPPGVVQGSRSYVVASGSHSRPAGQRMGPATGPSETEPEPDPAYTRRERQKWSATDPRAGRTSFTLDILERFIRVRLWHSGGFGTSYGIRAEVYEVVGGEAELLKRFCTSSGLLAVTPGATIEVRPIQGGCDGNNFTLGGTTSVRFYR